MRIMKHIVYTTVNIYVLYYFSIFHVSHVFICLPIIMTLTHFTSSFLLEIWFSLVHIIHLLTGYEGNSTFIALKVPTIFRGNAEGNSWYRGAIKVLLPEYQIYKCFIILNNCAIQNSKLGPFLMDF